MIRKEVSVTKSVLAELRRIVEDSDVSGRLLEPVHDMWYHTKALLKCTSFWQTHHEFVPALCHRKVLQASLPCLFHM